MMEILDTAKIVVCHGGTGSLITALRAGCHVIAMARVFELGEHYDNHQVEITSAFAERGLITVARSPEEIVDAIRRLRTQRAIVASSDPAELVEYLKRLFSAWPGFPVENPPR
jgi:UDP-N-acetylglucosamine transferase subunit ALG13